MGWFCVWPRRLQGGREGESLPSPGLCWEWLGYHLGGLLGVQEHHHAPLHSRFISTPLITSLPSSCGPWGICPRP